MSVIEPGLSGLPGDDKIFAPGKLDLTHLIFGDPASRQYGPSGQTEVCNVSTLEGTSFHHYASQDQKN